MDIFKRCFRRINWTEVLVDVGIEGKEKMLADSQFIA